MDNAQVLRPYGPGKFNTILDSYVYSVSLDGCNDDELSVGGTAVVLLRHGHSMFKDHDPLRESLTEAESDYLRAKAGAILTETSDGFVSVSYFDTMPELDAAWFAFQADANRDDF